MWFAWKLARHSEAFLLRTKGQGEIQTLKKVSPSVTDLLSETTSNWRTKIVIHYLKKRVLLVNQYSKQQLAIERKFRFDVVFLHAFKTHLFIFFRTTSLKYTNSGCFFTFHWGPFTSKQTFEQGSKGDIHLFTLRCRAEWMNTWESKNTRNVLCFSDSFNHIHASLNPVCYQKCASNVQADIMKRNFCTKYFVIKNHKYHNIIHRDKEIYRK